jgi:hypothetical protein
MLVDSRHTFGSNRLTVVGLFVDSGATIINLHNILHLVDGC